MGGENGRQQPIGRVVPNGVKSLAISLINHGSKPLEQQVKRTSVALAMASRQNLIRIYNQQMFSSWPKISAVPNQQFR